MKSKRTWLLVCLAIFVATLGYLYLRATPRFTEKIPIRDETPQTIQIAFIDEDKTISDSILCANFNSALLSARGGGLACHCGELGEIELRYSDGVTVTMSFHPGHGRKMNLILNGHRYSMAGGAFSDNLKAMGVWKTLK